MARKAFPTPVLYRYAYELAKLKWTQYSHSYEASPFGSKAVNMLLLKQIPHARVEVRVWPARTGSCPGFRGKGSLICTLYRCL